jgi:hypothetical protein
MSKKTRKEEKGKSSKICRAKKRRVKVERKRKGRRELK